MELSIREDGRVTIVSVSGDLVIGDSEAAFKKEILRLLEQGKVDLLIDCTALRVVDSTGLGALVRAMTTSQNEGGQTKLLKVGPQLKRLLELTRLDSVFETFDDPGKAVSSF
ncbi:MAG TPA: STAS domain-containing protein [Thermoanaerobaculia bacterium]|nr:STAS domain-containing protein [Thermoanaerobaculia bacterium]